MCYVDIMSTKDYKNKKLAKAEARKLIIEIAANGRVLLSTRWISCCNRFSG